MSKSPVARPPPPFIKPSFQIGTVEEDEDLVSGVNELLLFYESSGSEDSSLSTSDSFTTGSSSDWTSDLFSSSTSSSSSAADSSNVNSSRSSDSGSSTSNEFSFSDQRSKRGGKGKMGGPLDMTLPELLKHWAEYRPNTPALVFHHPHNEDSRTVITYGDLYTLGARCASILRGRGARRECVLLVLLPNTIERAIIEVAAILLGAFTVTATCKKDGSDLEAMLKKTYASGVIFDIDLQFRVSEVVRSLCQLFDSDRGTLVSAKYPNLHFVLRVKRVCPSNENDFMGFLREVYTKEYTLTTPCLPHHPCVVLCAPRRVNEKEDTIRESRTYEDKGMEGNSDSVHELWRPPKLVVHSHRNILAYSKIFMPRTDSPRPMYFLNYPFGNVRGHLAVSLCNPVTRILLDERDGVPSSLPHTIYRVLTTEKCPIAVLPPSVIHPLAEIFEKKQEGCPFKLTFVGFVGEPTNNELLSKALQFSHMVMVSYVTSELLLVAVDVISDPTKTGCGQVVQPGVFINTTDADGNSLPPGEEGYMQIRTPLMFKMYLHDRTFTQECFASDGFFKTGELGKVLNNYLYLGPKGR